MLDAADEIERLAAKLEAAEEECDFAKVEIARLHDDIHELTDERDALLAKIETMEKQKPVGTLHDDGYFVWSVPSPYESNYAGWKTKLYALLGAKGE